MSGAISWNADTTVAMYCGVHCSHDDEAQPTLFATTADSDSAEVRCESADTGTRRLIGVSKKSAGLLNA